MTLDPADVLALLEEKPYHDDELVACLEVPPDVLRFTMKALKRDGKVKRVGVDSKWALASYVAQAGRPVTVDRDACRLAIKHALAAGPLATTAIQARTGYSETVIKEECARLLELLEIQHFGNSRSSRWALPDYQPPAPASGSRPSNERKKPEAPAQGRVQHREPSRLPPPGGISVAEQASGSNRLLGDERTRVYPADVVDQELEDLDELEPQDDGDELELPPAPTPKGGAKGWRRENAIPVEQREIRKASLKRDRDASALASAAGNRLRQPHERPPSQTVKTADTLNWWATAPREGFSAVAGQHETRMRESKEARSVALKLLQ